MKTCKRLKDPIYGYINIPSDYMDNIIDTSTFQRLRRIIQTSYSPLYSSAVHNRFVHSIGVFYLGNLAAIQLTKEIEKKIEVLSFNLEIYSELFKLACLLHDVGHAPFSHTGENFYLSQDRDYTQLHNKLIKLVDVIDFKNDIPTNSSLTAAPHEIMSSIIGLSQFEDLFDDNEQKEFFARCITGYKYSNNSIECSIKNCFISMLNSKVIDVDKLDYLIRDAYITGFDTVNIDYERLLSSLTISQNTNHNYEVSYYKNAISVIENVVYAHDAERKWIQSHPIVLYEAYILQHIISNLNKVMDCEGQKLFSMESLSKEGQEFTNNISISLLCDDDIIFLMKNVYPDDLSKEFFERKARRHPVWKSEAEYKAFILDLTTGGSLLTKFEKAMSATATYLIKNTDSWVIDDNFISKLENEEAEIAKGAIGPLDETSKEVQKENKKLILKVVKSLKDYADQKKMDCNFVILKASQFNSGFGKQDFSETNIAFLTNDGEKICKVGKIVSSLDAKERDRDDFFYIFYKRQQDNIDNQEICVKLFKDVTMS
jgi:HD superfamily phosphohydrolase